MGSFIEAAAAVLSRAEQRVEVSAQNIANMATPGYRRMTSFAQALAAGADATDVAYSIDMTAGKLVTTNNPFDLAISGDGLFVVRSANGVFYTRAGQFQRDGDGRLVNTQGFALQSEDGGDLTLQPGSTVKVQSDGTVLEDGQPTGKIAVASLNNPLAATYAEGGVLSAPSAAVTSVEAPDIRQGAYETSNVSSGDEMVTIMAALRQAESGQKLVGVWDDLMGRILETFGQGSGA
jgi:flagellar basal-body rod protein FlgG